MSYTITPLDPQGHQSALLDLWSRNFPGAGAARFHWLYEHGPAHGWIAHRQGGEVVGGAGLMRRRMVVFGETVTAGQAIDLNVDRRHRAFGPARALEGAVSAAVADGALGLIYALPNRQSEAIFRRAGYREVGCLERWVRPLRWESVLRHRAPASLPGRLLLRCADGLLALCSRETFSPAPRRLRAEVQDGFDTRFDALWERAAKNVRVAGERTQAYLNWRFGSCPGAEHRVLGISNEDRELLAYVVFSRHGDTVAIDDFLALAPHGLDAALQQLLRRVRGEGAHRVVAAFLGSPAVARRFRRFGFWRRPSEWKLVVQGEAGSEAALEDALFDPANWHLTRADIDTDEDE